MLTGGTVTVPIAAAARTGGSDDESQLSARPGSGGPAGPARAEDGRPGPDLRAAAPGDRVGLMLPNVPAFPIAFYGALAAGAVVVPMNPLLKSREVGYYLSDSGARVVLAWHTAAGEAAKGAADAGAQSIAVATPDLADLLAEHAPATEQA